MVEAKLAGGAARAANELPFIRAGYAAMGVPLGGAIGGLNQVVADRLHGRWSSPADVLSAIGGGAVAGWQATHGRPVLGAAAGSAATTGAQDVAHGKELSVTNILTNAEGAAYLGGALNNLGVKLSNELPFQLKGKLGEGLSHVKSWARGEPIPLKPRPLPNGVRPPPGLANKEGIANAGGQRTIRLGNKRSTRADWVTDLGRVIEAKFGETARLSPSQKLALEKLKDIYLVDHWKPQHVGELLAGWFGAPTGKDVARVSPNSRAR
jgi:hypothetical protein